MTLGFTLRVRQDLDDRMVRALMTIQLAGKSAAAIRGRLSGIPEIRVLHTTNGTWDLIAEIRVDTLPDLDRVLGTIRAADHLTLVGRPGACWTKPRSDGGDMELITLHRRAVEQWVARVAAVKDEQWVDPTPCTEWSVRELVNHVVAEELWTVPLLGGETVQEVGSQFDGDVLGDDPLGRARRGAAEAVAIVEAMVPGGGRVQLSYGEEDMGEYVRQLCADHLIHGWDLAAATGGDSCMDPELVADVGAWFAGREAMYRGANAIGPRVSTAGDSQSDLLAAFGRTSQWGANHAALARFSAAFGSGDVDAIMARMTDDCVFESTGPSPDGQRHEGQAAVRAVWEQFFGETKDAKFTDEDTFLSGDRACVRWRFTWTNDDGSEGHVRGVDVIRFRDGLVSEKHSYVKG